MKFTIEQVKAMTTMEQLREVVDQIRSLQTETDFDVDAANALLDAVEARKAELTVEREEFTALERPLVA